MERKELRRMAEQEVQWLRYYGYREDTEAYNTSMGSPYDHVQSIGYTKSIIPLWERCAPGILTSDRPVPESTVEELRLERPDSRPEQVFLTPLGEQR